MLHYESMAAFLKWCEDHPLPGALIILGLVIMLIMVIRFVIKESYSTRNTDKSTDQYIKRIK